MRVDWFTGPLMVLSCWIIPLVLMASWPLLWRERNKPRVFLALNMFLAFFLLSAFGATNYVWFFVCFESTVIPICVIVAK